jgi:enoyl-CoA hydratase
MSADATSPVPTYSYPKNHNFLYFCRMNFEHIILNEQLDKHIGLVQLNRPKELNALSLGLMNEVKQACEILDANPEVRVIILTGNERAFAAGADIKQMQNDSVIDVYEKDLFSTWEAIRRVKKPIIAAVSGFALGGGCELSMICDMIVASETAQFGQPEIKIGTMPGAGGTQRLTKVFGKAKAMELALTGRFINAHEALRYGLVNCVVPVELYMDEAIKLAKEIASMAPIAVKLIKQSINKSFELSLNEGLAYERANFFITFSSEDQKEGMAAFIEKRVPVFKGR